MELAPIALFVYNRPAHTKRTITALKNNNLAKESNLIIFSDGSKNQHDKSSVQEVRDYIKTINGFKNITKYENKTNNGLANTIIQSITSVLNIYNKIIVLEDDLITAPDFLKYMNLALNKYENQETVMQISGYQYPVCMHGNKFYTVLHRRATSWGWATWKRAWQHFNPDIDSLINSFDAKSRYSFNIDGTADRFNLLLRQQKREVDSWAIRWGASVHLKKGLVLWPSQSLIQNIGMDGSGTHSTNNELVKGIDKFPQIKNLKFPKRVCESQSYLLKMKKFYSNFSKLSLTQKIKYHKKHMINALTK